LKDNKNDFFFNLLLMYTLTGLHLKLYHNTK